METKEKDNIEATADSSFASEVIKGLSSTRKRISSRFLYDKKGDQLFQKIMQLPEYYLTRCEADILEIYKEEISRICCDNEPFKLIDLGAGDGSKTEILIRYFCRKNLSFEYVPVDISENVLEGLISKVQSDYPGLQAKGINLEYTAALKSVQDLPEKKLVLFLGSNLGNFDFRDAQSFLRKINENLNVGDKLLLGLDLKKDPETILNAYDDKQGITTAFNFNLLDRINEELGGDFKKENFIHAPSYDPETGEVKSFLVSKISHNVNLRKVNRSFSFDKWETIQTECSNKYDARMITELACSSGWKIMKSFFDSKGYFTDTLWCKV